MSASISTKLTKLLSTYLCSSSLLQTTYRKLYSVRHQVSDSVGTHGLCRHACHGRSRDQRGRNRFPRRRFVAATSPCTYHMLNIALGREPAEKVAETLAEARAAVGESKAHLVGVGFVGWVLDKFNTAADPRLQAVLDQQPGAIWLAYGQNLGKYIVQVREHNAAHGRNILVFLTVNTVDEAIRAVNEWRADVIVAQGRHMSSHLLGSLNTNTMQVPKLAAGEVSTLRLYGNF